MCHLCTFFRMSVKMIDSCLIRCLAYRLCNIVKQRRQTQDFLILYLLYHMDRMLSHRITVMRIVLLCLHQYGKLRQYHIGDPACIDFPDQFRMIWSQQFDQFCLYPLCTDLFNRLCQFPDRRKGLFFHFKTKLCRKPQCPKHPQCILRKTLFWISHAADHFFLQITHSVKGIHQPTALIVRHGINRKIPAF